MAKAKKNKASRDHLLPGPMEPIRDAVAATKGSLHDNELHYEKGTRMNKGRENCSGTNGKEAHRNLACRNADYTHHAHQ
jgi:hypothetical protein